MVGNDLSYSYVSFGLKNPKSAMLRAEKLKKTFAENGLNYIMPKDTWSNKKIEENLLTVNKYINYFLKTNTLMEETVQGAINHILPKEARNSIVVKDISKIEESMLKKGYLRAQIDCVKNSSGGVSVPPCGNVKEHEIFVNFKHANNNPNNAKYIRTTILHELQHALKHQYQNINSSMMSNYLNKNTFYDDINIFHQFEEKFYPYLNKLQPSTLSDKDFYKQMKVSSRDELYKKFNETLNQIEKKNSNSYKDFAEKKYYGKYSKKDFFEYMKNRANDEKFSQIIEKKSTPAEDYTVYNYFTNLYAEMARFFAELKNKAKF